MIEKEIVFSHESEDTTIEKINPGEVELEKVASNEISDEIQDYITNHIQKDPNYLYVLVCALGAGEVWGDNINSDYFEEEEIKNSYKTFEEVGHVFTHHKNKDPKNSKGDILLAHWNDRMHRVELIVKIDRRKAPKICKDIDNGKMWDVSMGCRVPYDVCSVCGNVAKTTKDYCTHVKNHKGKVLPDGRKVYMINKKPTFFDISFVYVGADEIAKTLRKIASARDKRASIDKDLPGEVISTDAAQIAASVMKDFEKIKRFERRIPNQLLDRLSNFDFLDVLTTLLSLGIALRPEEFQRIYFNKIGENPDFYEKRNICISPDVGVQPDERFNPFNGDISIKVVRRAFPVMPERSAYKDYLYPRLIKMANRRQPRQSQGVKKHLAVPAVIGGSALYKRYLDEIPQGTAEGVDKKIKDNPWMLPVLGTGAIAAMRGADQKGKQDQRFHEKTAGNLGGRAMVGIPAAYLASSIAKDSNSNNRVVNFIAEKPALTAALGVAATNTKDDWKALKNAATVPDGALNKEAARMMEPEQEKLLKQTENLYEKYHEVDDFYNKVTNVGQNLIRATNPKQFIGSAVDSLAGKALIKTLSNS